MKDGLVLTEQPKLFAGNHETYPFFLILQHTYEVTLMAVRYDKISIRLKLTQMSHNFESTGFEDAQLQCIFIRSMQKHDFTVN